MIRFALATIVLSALVPAQGKLFGGNGEDRKASTKFLLDEAQGYKMLGSVCIQYGSPTWKSEYDGMVEQAKGKSFRLGKNFWTTLNTSSSLSISGTNIPAGAYYLGAHCDEKGEFHLLVIDAKTADSKAWTPFNSAEWKPTYTCALKHGTSKTSVSNLSIGIEGEDPAALQLQVTWGTHTFSAPLEMKTGTGSVQDAAGKVIEKAKTEAVEAVKKLPEAVKKD
ncbi:MAG: DUF2911 domain-containing protein [Planctomycetota bacterium]